MANNYKPRMRNPPEPLMLPEEVAEIFGVGRETIIRWAAAGRLPGFKTLGGQWRFEPLEVRKKFKEHSEGSLGE